MGDFHADDIAFLHTYLAQYRVTPTAPGFDSTALELLNADSAPDRLLTFGFIARVALSAWLKAVGEGEVTSATLLKRQIKDYKLNANVIGKNLGRDESISELANALYARLSERPGVYALLLNNRRHKGVNRRLLIYLAVRRYANAVALKA